jgi:hypothetical protein
LQGPEARTRQYFFLSNYVAFYLPIQLVIVHLVEGVIPFLPQAANFDPQLLQASAEFIGHLLQFCLAPKKN